MNRIIHSSAATAMALQNAAELRRAQTANAQTTTQQTAARYNFAEIFGGTNWGATEDVAKPSTAKGSSPAGFDSAIATATATVVGEDTNTRRPVAITTLTDTAIETATTAATTTAATTAPATTAPATAAAAATTTGAAVTTEAAAAASAVADTTSLATVTNPGVGALVTAILNGSFQPTYVTNPAQLQETTSAGTDTMPNVYYASDQTAAQLAQLLGGTVVQMPPFGQSQYDTEPNANFIQLPNGQTFNAADVAYYANTGSEGPAQLTADLTASINEGSAWTNYYQHGGQMPTFTLGYVGPPISGMTYPADMIGADGNVINPAMQSTTATGT